MQQVEFKQNDYRNLIEDDDDELMNILDEIDASLVNTPIAPVRSFKATYQMPHLMDDVDDFDN